MMNDGNSTGKMVAGLAAGAVVGAALGLLLAPNPGKQSRNTIRLKTQKTLGLVRDAYKKRKVSTRVEDEVNGVLESSY